MEKTICVYPTFLSDEMKTRLDEIASKAGYRVCYYTEDQYDEAAECLKEAEILFGDSPALFLAAPDSLKWYSATTAGVDALCTPENAKKKPDSFVTNCNAYGVTLSEYVVMAALMVLRKMPNYQEPLYKHIWTGPVPVRSIRDSRVLILGAGNVGVEIANRMRGMNASHIIGISRSGKARNPEAFDETRPISELDTCLPDTDILIMALPNTPETRGTLTAERIALLPSTAVVVNVGRGNAIDQEALMSALNEDRLFGAALDVMYPEPLPSDHPLWDTKNLFLTPHFAGKLTLEYTRRACFEAFCENFENYAAGRPLRQLVDRGRGY